MPDYQVGSTRLWGHASRDDFLADIRAVAAEQDRAHARGFKWMRLPIMSATIASSAVQFGPATGQVLGPEQGYIWAIRRLVISGLTSGATPDVVNLYLNDRFSGPPIWQFNGNNFGYTFGKLELILQPGDNLSFKNSGTIAATGAVTISGELTEVPAEMLWKLD